MVVDTVSQIRRLQDENIKNVTSESRNEKMENTIVTSKKRQRVYRADRVKNKDKFNLQRLG